LSLNFPLSAVKELITPAAASRHHQADTLKEQETSKDEQLMVIMEHKEGDMPTRSAQ